MPERVPSGVGRVRASEVVAPIRCGAESTKCGGRCPPALAPDVGKGGPSRRRLRPIGPPAHGEPIGSRPPRSSAKAGATTHTQSALRIQASRARVRGRVFRRRRGVAMDKATPHRTAQSSRRAPAVGVASCDSALAGALRRGGGEGRVSRLDPKRAVKSPGAPHQTQTTRPLPMHPLALPRARARQCCSCPRRAR